MPASSSDNASGLPLSRLLASAALKGHRPDHPADATVLENPSWVQAQGRETLCVPLDLGCGQLERGYRDRAGDGNGLA